MDEDKTYMQHICIGRKCGAIFIAEDLYDRIDPEKYRYCPECEAKGKRIIREDKNKKVSSEERKLILMQNLKRAMDAKHTHNSHNKQKNKQLKFDLDTIHLE